MYHNAFEAFALVVGQFVIFLGGAALFAAIVLFGVGFILHRARLLLKVAEYYLNRNEYQKWKDEKRRVVWAMDRDTTSDEDKKRLAEIDDAMSGNNGVV